MKGDCTDTKPTNTQKTESIKDRFERLLKEALSGTSARSKNTIITEALTLVGDLK